MYQPQLPLRNYVPRRESWIQTPCIWHTAVPPCLRDQDLDVFMKKIQTRVFSVQELNCLLSWRKKKDRVKRRFFFFCEPHPCMAHLGILRKSVWEGLSGERRRKEVREWYLFQWISNRGLSRCKSEQVKSIDKQVNYSEYQGYKDIGLRSS